MSRIARTAWLPLALALLFAPVLTALASPLSEAEEAGKIGERWDGYLGIVPGGDSHEIRDLVADVNARRRKQYEQIAVKNQISVEEVAKIAGKKLIEGTKPGRYVMPREGEWVKVK